jgi:hypothetical protein
MNLLPKTNQQVVFKLIIFSIFISTLAFIFIPKIDVEAELNAEKDIWKLPKINEVSNYLTIYKSLRKKLIWGVEIGSKKKEEDDQAKKDEEDKLAKEKAEEDKKNKRRYKDISWQFVGIILEENNRYILLSLDDKVTRYKQGNSLPDHAKLIKVNKDTIEIEQNDEIKILELYGY